MKSAELNESSKIPGGIYEFTEYHLPSHQRSCARL